MTFRDRARIVQHLRVARDAGSPSPESLKAIYPGNVYSPYAKRNFPSRVFWGDTHLHTGLSLDAGVFGNTLVPDDAYRFARGEEVKSSTGLPVKLARPLDWRVVTDHTDLMGIAPDIQNGAPNILASPKGKEWHDGYQEGGEAAGKAAFDLITNFSQMTIPEDLAADYSPGSNVFTGIWEQIIDAAERHNDPGSFTAFIGFEWTSVPKGFNLHRNVILRDNGDRARQVVPLTTQPPNGTTDPLDLYTWLEGYEAKTGGSAFCLAHNGNLSNGWLFPTEKTYHGGVVDQAYVSQVARWEPQYEITQIKGDGETHPVLSPADEFADYENWDKGNLDLTELKKPEMLKGEYAREALKQGLALEAKLGVNPYKFGFGGATDSHTALTTAEEENSREAIFDAMVRRETFGTTGPRMVVRFFGGWNFGEEDLRSRAPAFRGYEKGVPMGGDLRSAPAGAKAPNFLIVALRDPIGANLDRLQVVKGWLDGKGKLHEKVYDVAVSDGRDIDRDGRCRTPVGNTVDLEAANWTNTIGASELSTVWTDPDFDAGERAFYYVRVLEIPTPRWILYDRVRLGAKIPPEAELVGQERAYSSPIWYTP